MMEDELFDQSLLEIITKMTEERINQVNWFWTTASSYADKKMEDKVKSHLRIYIYAEKTQSQNLLFLFFKEIKVSENWCGNNITF